MYSTCCVGLVLLGRAERRPPQVVLARLAVLLLGSAEERHLQPCEQIAQFLIMAGLLSPALEEELQQPLGFRIVLRLKQAGELFLIMIERARE